ncbi:bacterial Ig-like domain-containing protein [Holzapfeliella sp. He02]|uniref:Bacterial Ig-like domain-containing protein n=1 Tax=Holzapfeliella saturejae TaxID=3082953 RepID=A0ABU8SE81_9LACO
MKKSFKYISTGLLASTLLMSAQQLTNSSVSTSVVQADETLDNWMPDKNLQQAVERQLGTDNITQANIENLTELNVQDTNITNLKGLEKAINLKELRFHNVNFASDLNSYEMFSYSELPESLDTLDLSGNNLSSNQLSTGFNLSDLKTLNVSQNKITDINFYAKSNLSNLKVVRADDNQISDVSVFSNQSSQMIANRNSLRYWTADNNQITDWSSFVGMNFDTSYGDYPSSRNQKISKNLPIKPLKNNTIIPIKNLTITTGVSFGESGTGEAVKEDDSREMNVSFSTGPDSGIGDNIKSDDWSESLYGIQFKYDATNNQILMKVLDNESLPQSFTIEIKGSYGHQQTLVTYSITDSRQSLSVKDVTLTKGQSFDKQDAFVSATDDYGEHVNFGNDISVEGTVDTQKVGTYQLTYSYGSQKKTATITVKEPAKETDNTDDSQNQLLNTKSQARYQTNQKAKQITDYVNQSTSLEAGQKQTVNNYVDSLKQSDLKKIDDETTFNGLRDILNQSQLKTSPSDIEALIQKLIGVSGTIHYIPNYGVQNWTFDQNGQLQPLTGSYTPSNSQVTGFDTKVVDGMSYIRIGSANSQTWVQRQYLSDSVETDLTAIATVGNTPTTNYAVYLRDARGDMTSQTVMPGTSWLVFAQKKIGGQTYYRIGNENQWIQAEFAKLS